MWTRHSRLACLNPVTSEASEPQVTTKGNQMAGVIWRQLPSWFPHMVLVADHDLTWGCWSESIYMASLWGLNFLPTWRLHHSQTLNLGLRFPEVKAQLHSFSDWILEGYPLQYFGASLMAQLVKNLPAMKETWVRSLCWEDPLEKVEAAHSSILAWSIP